MELNTLAIIWFGLWGVLWTVYFILEGYTLGTGMLLPFITKTKKERMQLQEAIGPFFGGNEVWLVTAGGATFAAFPAVYATMFSSLYEAMLLILFGIFLRAFGLEFMHKEDNLKWQNSFKWTLSISSFVLALLFGVAFANFYKGLELGPNGYEGSFFSLLEMYTVIGGVLFITLFMTSGSLWIQMKTAGTVADRAFKVSRGLAPAATALTAIFFVATMNETGLAQNYNDYPILWLIPSLTLVVGLLSILFVLRKKIALAFTMICLQIFTLMAFGFVGMFPNMLISSIDEQFSLTLYNSSGSQKNLQLMFFVAIVMVPIVIAYQIWAQVIFKKKITEDNTRGF